MNFPKNFTWGVATSAYQIEGATNVDGRADSIWDTFSRSPGNTVNQETGDVACEHYYRYKEDIALIASLNVNAYRFSIAWPRVQPLGAGAWNEKGFAFYEDIISELERHGIEAHITLYHWDLPQALEAVGGWRNRETSYHFKTYAQEVARRFGHRVKTIATHNEPWCTTFLGHMTGQFAPGLCDKKAAYQVAHHLLLSHGLALQAMRAVENCTAGLGIVLNQQPYYPADSHSESDRAQARFEDGTFNRWFMDPLFGRAYPHDIFQHLAENQPSVEAGDFDIISQSLDFLGVNYYTRGYCSTSVPPKEAPHLMGTTDMGWEIYPQGLVEHLVRITQDYSPPPIFITENGMANSDKLVDGRVKDDKRVEFLDLHLTAIDNALSLGVDVQGYFAWSLLDNYEWDSGYAKRFGLVHVDYATQERTIKDSGLWYRDFIRTQL